MDNDNVVRPALGQALPKAATFIKGLDQILEGGFPRSRTTLIKAAAGSGKTVLGLEFFYRGALNGEPEFHVTMEILLAGVEV